MDHALGGDLPTTVFYLRLTAAVIVVGQAAHAFGYSEYPVGVVKTETYGTLNFTEMFAGFGPDKINAQWTRAAFTSFAAVPPGRRFGADAEMDCDVAVLGAPFDTATSFRPG